MNRFEMLREWLRTDRAKRICEASMIFTFGLSVGFTISGEVSGNSTLSLWGNLLLMMSPIFFLRQDLIKDENMFDKRHDRFDKLADKVGRKSLLFIRVWLIRLLPVCFLMQFLWGWLVRGSSWMVFMFTFFLSIIALVLIGSPKEKQFVWKKRS